MQTPEPLHPDISAKCRYPFLCKFLLQPLLYLGETRFSLFLLQFAHLSRVLCCIRVYVREGEILKLAFHLPNAETVGNRRINFNGLKRNALALMRRHMLKRLHIVVTIGELHDEHADIACGGNKQSAKRLSMALRAMVLVRAELRHTINDEEKFLPEFLFNFFARNASVLNGIVEESRGNRGGVHSVFSQYLRRGGRVDEVWFARVPGLALVRLLRVVVRLRHEGDILGRGTLHLGDNLLDGCHRRLLYT